MPKSGTEGNSESGGGSGKETKTLYACGLDAAVDVVGGKWKPMILWALYAGATLRFGELRRHIAGISEKVLIQQLRELESDGIVHREVYREVPPKVEYSLTPLGQSLNEALIPLGVWGDEHMQQLVANRECKKDGKAA
ncbi:helix-turn-helix domain-containing protein [Streptomyces durmitorensis]|uniref:Helix-turn-helix transcriptional regulator n=1 Tax=Streptomyces durmitorensis TaxID=319947 RepID=A0ABY4PUG8_9ACTN|nr:helix-turn-helix domain-containing protein [Streptomyces durmitorensis]UQT56598.1 helix-turn-helix transcriptional regulator [Streptomyces durmitorensis]